MNLLREAEAQAEAAWGKYRSHRGRCPVCSRIDRDPTTPLVLCLVGSVLRDAWHALDDLWYEARLAALVARVLVAVGGGGAAARAPGAAS